MKKRNLLEKLCIAERDVILVKRVSVSSVGVKCTYIVSRGRLSLTQKKTGFRDRNYRISDKVRWYFTDEIRINRDTRYSQPVVCIRVVWIPREPPCILDISCFRVSRKYAYNVPVSESHSAKKYQQRKHRPLPIHLINITVTRSRFGSCRVIVQKDRSILYEWRMHSL